MSILTVSSYLSFFKIVNSHANRAFIVKSQELAKHRRDLISAGAEEDYEKVVEQTTEMQTNVSYEFLNKALKWIKLPEDQLNESHKVYLADPNHRQAFVNAIADETGLCDNSNQVNINSDKAVTIYKDMLNMEKKL